MNKENVQKIIILTALLAAGGCSSVPAQSGYKAAGQPILSAEDAQSMINVTVTTLAPVEEQDLIVAVTE